MLNKMIQLLSLVILILAAGCAPASASGSPAADILAVETFLADITRNVAGEQITVDALIPAGLDPHAYEPAPRDVARITDSQVLVINGAGFEAWLQPVLDNAGGDRLVIDASNGLTPRTPRSGELAESQHLDEIDPHFWLDPMAVVTYVENIRDGLSQYDPRDAGAYAHNADAYISQLRELDSWIRSQIEQIPPEKRLLVTNHESFGYFADRYGLTIVGAVIPSISSGAAPSARQMAELSEKIRAAGAPAVFIETGSNPGLAEQIAAETGARVVDGLYTHSVGPGEDQAPTYLDMMRHNTTLIVQALK